MLPPLTSLAATPTQTLAEVESFGFYSCKLTMTAEATVFIDGSSFPAEAVTYTFHSGSQSFRVIFNYPGVELTSLTPGETLLFVRLLMRVANLQYHTGIGTAAGRISMLR